MIDLQFFGHFANFHVWQVILVVIVAVDLQVLIIFDVLPSTQYLLADPFIRVLAVIVDVVEYLCKPLNFCSVIILVGDWGAFLNLPFASSISPMLHHLCAWNRVPISSQS